MTTYIVKIKKDKYREVRVEAISKQEARMKVENNDYDPVDGVKELDNGGWEVVDVTEAKG